MRKYNFVKISVTKLGFKAYSKGKDEGHSKIKERAKQFLSNDQSLALQNQPHNYPFIFFPDVISLGTRRGNHTNQLKRDSL